MLLIDNCLLERQGRGRREGKGEEGGVGRKVGTERERRERKRKRGGVMYKKGGMEGERWATGAKGDRTREGGVGEDGQRSFSFFSPHPIHPTLPLAPPFRDRGENCSYQLLSVSSFITMRAARAASAGASRHSTRCKAALCKSDKFTCKREERD